MTGGERDLVGYGGRPPRVEWPNGAALALTLAVNYEEGSETNHAEDGRNEGLAEIPYVMSSEYRDLAAESVYEYGSRAGHWRLLRLFAEYGLTVTYFAAAVALERNLEAATAIADAGHEVCGHGWRWEEHWLLDPDQEREHIQAAVQLIERTTGGRPVGWYCRYGPSIHTREIVATEGGFTYDSDAYNDDLPYFVEVAGHRHLVIPYTFTYNDGRYVLSQGYSSPGDFVDVCRRGIDELRKEGHDGYPKMMNIGLHPRWSGQAGRTSALREVLEHALACGDVWIARRRDIADWWHAHDDAFGR